MKKIVFPLLAMIALVVACGVKPESKTMESVMQKMQGNGTITWKAESPKYQAEGSFDSWKFTNLSVTDGDFTKVNVGIEIDVNSINEKADGLVSHLKAADFFDVVNFPMAKVDISGATKTDDGSYVTDAVVTVKGKQAKAPTKFTVSGTGPFTINGTATVPREELEIGIPLEQFAGITKNVEVQFSAEIGTL